MKPKSENQKLWEKIESKPSLMRLVRQLMLDKPVDQLPYELLKGIVSTFLS